MSTLNLLPFNIEIARINPKRVVTRGGHKISNISIKKDKHITYGVSVQLEDYICYLATEEGKFHIYGIESEYDLFLLPESDKTTPPEPKDAATIARERNIELMKELGFEIKILGGGYQVLKDGVKLCYCSYLTPLQDFPKLISNHVIPYYEKRAYEKGQLDLKKTINNLLSIDNHKN